ncbi:methyltransferase domain-containing protein [Pelagibacterales bacterium SAG-MED48]|nr:methyltransferase domain-containing protein [Pelagibacterales bacterium SAG-MED48]
MSFKPFINLPGKFSSNDGTIDFYLRVRSFLDKNKIVLDLGAGSGNWYNNTKDSKILKDIQYIKKDVKKFYAADIDKAVLKNKSSHKNIIIKNNKIPIKSKSIDIIISDWTFEHIEKTNLFYNEIDRVLKKNGILCFRTPHKYNYFSIINLLIEGTKFKDILLKTSQPGRKEYFKSFYRLNTKNKIKKIFKNYEINYFLFKPDPAYFFGSKIIYKFLCFIHLIMPKFLVGIIFCFMKKKN